jgi:hypothetical protein
MHTGGRLDGVEEIIAVNMGDSIYRRFLDTRSIISSKLDDISVIYGLLLVLVANWTLEARTERVQS